MTTRLKRWWPLVKLLVGVIIVVLVGVRFVKDLLALDLRDLVLRPAWLALSALLYVVGLAFSAGYWNWLLWRFGDRPGLLASLRAYYVGHLGKYVPGKALALVMRASLITSPQVRFGAALITAFYEVLTTMASGALVAALFLAVWPPRVARSAWDPTLLGVLLLLLAGLPLLPAVLNRLVRGLARRFQRLATFRLPELSIGTLLAGVAMTAVGWLLLGLSLWAVLQGLLPVAVDLDGAGLARFTAMTSLAYVAGFMALVVPSGMGVREVVLLQFLPPEVPDAGRASSEAIAATAILVLRLVWTAAELLVAGVLYFWPGAARLHLEPELVNE